MSDEELDENRAAEVEWQKRRDKSRKIHLAKDVKSMKEEVPPWINSVLGAPICSEENIIEELQSGETLLHCARTLQIIKSEKDEPGKTFLAEREIRTLFPEEIGDVGAAQIFAKHRSNLERFVRWSKKIGVRDDNLFDPGDLVQDDPDTPRALIQDRQVLNCMLRVSKIMAPYGIEPPKSVKKEIKQDERRKTLKKQKSRGAVSAPVPVSISDPIPISDPEPPKEDTPPSSPGTVVTPVVIERSGVQYYTFASAASPPPVQKEPTPPPSPPPEEVVTPPEEMSVATQDESLLYTTAEAVAFTTAASFFPDESSKQESEKEEEEEAETYQTAYIDSEISASEPTEVMETDPPEVVVVPADHVVVEEEEIPVTNIGLIYSDIEISAIEAETLQQQLPPTPPIPSSDTESSISEDEIIIDFAPAAVLAASENEQSRLSSTPLSDHPPDDADESSRESPAPPTPDFTPDEPVIKTTDTVVNIAVVQEGIDNDAISQNSTTRSSEKELPMEVQEPVVFATDADEYAQVNKLPYLRKSETFIKEKPGINASAVLIGLLAFLVVGGLVAVFSVVFTQN